MVIDDVIDYFIRAGVTMLDFIEPSRFDRQRDRVDLGGVIHQIEQNLVGGGAPSVGRHPGSHSPPIVVGCR
jgi:hypothetical protein